MNNPDLIKIDLTSITFRHSRIVCKILEELLKSSNTNFEIFKYADKHTIIIDNKFEINFVPYSKYFVQKAREFRKENKI